MALLDETEALSRLYGLCDLYLRRPASYSADASGVTAVTFEPPLTSAEQATFDRLVRLARAVVAGISPAEWQAIEPDIATCRAFLGLAAPTNAQVVAATKAHMRITAALLRA